MRQRWPHELERIKRIQAGEGIDYWRYKASAILESQSPRLTGK